MACKVGSANPDIAGLGIMISFAFQAGLSLCLSICSLSLWESAVLSVDEARVFVFGDTSEGMLVPYGFSPADLTLVINTLAEHRPDSRLKRFCVAYLTALVQPQAPMPSVGKWMWRWGERAAMRKKCIDDILATVSDVQAVNAIGLLIAALAQHKNLSLYHLHVVYDTASFTGISICASLINVSAYAHNLKRTRTFAIVAYLCLFLSFSIVFGIKLNNWDENVAGHCYNTRLISSSDDPHPSSDMIYLGVTCFYSICALLSCYRSGFAIPALVRVLKQPFQSDPIQRFIRKLGTSSRLKNAYLLATSLSVTSPNAFSGVVYIIRYFALLAHPKPEYRAWALMPLAMGQYPLHLYMAIAIRKGNERFLEGDSENDWGFGQIVALVMCAATCIECIRGVSEYRKAVGAEPVQPPVTQTPGQIV